MKGRVIPIHTARNKEADARAQAISDDSLVAACAIGDHAGLVALFDRHHLRLHRFLCRVASVGTIEAEDLLQDTYSAIWVSAARFKGESPALTWMFGIAANVARNHARGRERRASAMHVLGEQPPMFAEAVDDTAARRETLHRVKAALATLPHDHRVALVMCDLEGATGEDAARALGVRPGTIWRWLHEARKELRRMIEEER